MKKNILSIVIPFAILFLWTSGCKTTGYIVRVETAAITYDAFAHVESLLSRRGYNMVVKEKKRYEGAADNDLTTVFEKKYDAPEPWRHTIFVAFFYEKNISDNRALHLRVDVYNHYVGIVVPEIKMEIESVGDLIFRAIANQVGESNVRIERIEWGPPLP